MWSNADGREGDVGVEVREGVWCAWFGMAGHQLLEERRFRFGGYEPDCDACQISSSEYHIDHNLPR